MSVGDGQASFGRSNHRQQQGSTLFGEYVMTIESQRKDLIFFN